MSAVLTSLAFDIIATGGAFFLVVIALAIYRSR